MATLRGKTEKNSSCGEGNSHIFLWGGGGEEFNLGKNILPWLMFLQIYWELYKGYLIGQLYPELKLKTVKQKIITTFCTFF